MASTNVALYLPTLAPLTRSVDQRYVHSHFPKYSYFPCYQHFNQRNVGNDQSLLSVKCKAATSSSEKASYITEFDLYELLGIDSSSDEKQIKMAYRSLQKRCHPDIAGPAGHDMAIILNEAYALLSDPIARFAYDKEQAKSTELRGYTGQPTYSVWMGSESEQRAVFVDEVKCVGCLKCALFADKTFAIESAYGRARVVAQWADPEDKIQASIDACPVNCISTVERSELAALEFLMSKQPRGKVRIGASNTAGARSFDVFSEVKVFHKRLAEAMTTKSQHDSKFSKYQKDARISAIQAIRSISNWLYWQSPPSDTSLSLTKLKGINRTLEPDIEKLRDIATAARNQGMLKTGDSRRLLPQAALKDEYWTPSTPETRVKTKNTSNADTAIHTPSAGDGNSTYENTQVKREIKQRRPIITVIPLGLAMLAAINMQLHGAGGVAGGLDGHIGGAYALQIVNSSWLQVFLAGVPWYFIGVALERLIDGFSRRE